jgi:hypothetical protein
MTESVWQLDNNPLTILQMIVPSMNSRELYAEIFSDYRIVSRKAYYLALSLRRSAMKSKHKHVREIFEYKSKQRNNWIIAIDCFVKGYDSSTTVYYLDKYGLNGISVNTDGVSLSHYTPHFLDRYNERFLKDTDLSKLDLLKLFVVNNPIEALEEIPDIESNQYKVFGRFNEGVGLGYKEVFSEAGNEIIHFKTFISNEMILDGQRDGFKTLGEYYDETYGELLRINKRRA